MTRRDILATGNSDSVIPMQGALAALAALGLFSFGAASVAMEARHEPALSSSSPSASMVEPIPLYLHYNVIDQDTSWYLNGDRDEGAESFTGRADVAPPLQATGLGILSAGQRIDASTERLFRAFHVRSADLNLRVASILQGEVHLQAALFLNFRQVGYEERSIDMPLSLPGDLGWKDVRVHFDLPAEEVEVNDARIVVTWELDLGHDWHVMTDGSSGLTLFH